MTKKIALGMSGGVDSSVSAALLKAQGHQVTGVYLDCWRGPGCRAEEDRKDALDVALQLDIPFKVLDFKQHYKQAVVDYFYQEYAAGRTPNPDIMCNKEIKFGMFYEWAMKHGFDAVATGHYAQVLHKQNHFHLGMGADPKKDQSYFLYRLSHEQLAHIMFPIGHLHKHEVRQIAKEFGLPVSNKADSQGICFIGEVSTPEFLRELGMVETTGLVNIIPAQSQHSNLQLPVGEHNGAWFYTIGQRHGFSVLGHRENVVKAGYQPDRLPALYVIDKDVHTNTLLVGPRESLYKTKAEIEAIHYINSEYQNSSTMHDAVYARVRHGGSISPVTITRSDQDSSSSLLEWNQAQFGLAPGQSVVLYQNSIVLGGAVIASVI